MKCKKLSNLLCFLIFLIILGCNSSIESHSNATGIKLVFSDFKKGDEVKFVIGENTHYFIVDRYDSSGISKILNDSIHSSKYNYSLSVNYHDIYQGKVEIHEDTKILYISPYDLEQSSYNVVLMD